MLLGGVVCLIASKVNSLLPGFFGDGGVRYVSTNITEEVAKALPALCFALLLSDSCDTRLSISLAMGLGFAVLKNTATLTGSIEKMTVLCALVRGFGAARMHGACTSMIGRGISYVPKRRKPFYCGPFSLLISAVIAHALFNTLFQSIYRLAAYGVIVVMYIPQLLRIGKRMLSKKESERQQHGQEARQ